MRIKGGLLIFLTVCLGTALAMTASEQEHFSGDVVGAVTKDVRSHGMSDGAERVTEMHFDLSAIKRPIPKTVRVSGLFESRSWYAQPVQAPPVQPSGLPRPMTPSLSFTYIGRMIDGSDVTLFLSRNDRQYTVKENDVLDNTYKIDKIGEASAVLIYLPTNTQQILLFNAPSGAVSQTSALELKDTMRPVIPSTQYYPTN